MQEHATPQPTLLHLGFAHLLCCLPPSSALLLSSLCSLHLSQPVRQPFTPAKMPRDLLADKATLDDMPQLSREPAASSPPPTVSSPMPLYSSALVKHENPSKMGAIHPFAQLLNRDDVDDCDWLEHAAFDPNEAATREKVSISLHRSLLLIYILLSLRSPSFTLRLRAF